MTSSFEFSNNRTGDTGLNACSDFCVYDLHRKFSASKSRNEKENAVDRSFPAKRISIYIHAR
jgi:hypothetical protein